MDRRRQVTDQAIVEAVLSRTHTSVFDSGCGEGWLARELSARRIDAVGLDVAAQLIEVARQAGALNSASSPMKTLRPNDSRPPWMRGF